jgi:Mor family transcriptional regulator
MSANLHSANNVKNSQYPEILSELAAYVAEQLTKDGIDPSRAADIGFAAAETIRENFSGHPTYWPKGIQFECSMRDAQIYNEFNGTNHATLADKYGLTEVRIYQIIKRVFEQQRKRLQPDMFD